MRVSAQGPRRHELTGFLVPDSPRSGASASRQSRREPVECVGGAGAPLRHTNMEGIAYVREVLVG
jgi:hypothetical protein